MARRVDAVVLMANFQIQSPVNVQMVVKLFVILLEEWGLEGGVVWDNYLYFEEEDS